MRKVLVFTLVLAAVLLTTVSANAQQARHISIEPRASYWFPEDADENASGYGAALELMIGRRVGLVLAGDFWTLESETFAGTIQEATGFDIHSLPIDEFPELEISDYSVGLIIYLGWGGRINPYVTAGIDYFQLDIQYNGIYSDVVDEADIQGTVGWHAGVGLDIALATNLSIIVEGRYFDTTVDVEVGDIDFADFDVTGFAFLGGIAIGF